MSVLTVYNMRFETLLIHVDHVIIIMTRALVHNRNMTPLLREQYEHLTILVQKPCRLMKGLGGPVGSKDVQCTCKIIRISTEKKTH